MGFSFESAIALADSDGKGCDWCAQSAKALSAFFFSSLESATNEREASSWVLIPWAARLISSSNVFIGTAPLSLQPIIADQKDTQIDLVRFSRSRISHILQDLP